MEIMVMLSFLLLKLVLLNKSSNASSKGLSDELHFIHQEMGSLRDENRKQNMEIASLKDTVQLQNKTISQHEIIIKELIADNHRIDKRNHPVSSAAMSRRKRPAQLVPTSDLYDERKNDAYNQNRKLFYGPPTNCSDLILLGHTLNGYYLVKSPALSDDFKKTTKLETVFCAFKQAETHNPILVQQEVIPPPSSPNPLPSPSFSSPPPKFGQETFKTTTGSVALIKKRKQSSCIPLWQLKIRKPAGIHCLSVEHINISNSSIDRPVLKNCEDRYPPVEQKWSMIESKNSRVRICQEKSNQCLTFAFGTEYLPDFPHVSLKNRDEKSKGQLFKMNIETSQIKIVEPGSCLVGKLRNVPYVPGVGVHGCNEATDNITFKKWSIVPLKNCV